MLKVLRKKGVAKKILWVIAIVIILSFGVFGSATLLSRNERAPYAGKIFGKKVSYEEFESAYASVRLQAILRYGENFNNVQQFLNLESDTWDRLILLYEAKRRRVKITNDAVISAIAKHPLFQRNGTFDQKLYSDILTFALRTTPRQFEENVRDTLKIAALYSQASTSVVITEDDVRQAYVKAQEKIQVSYAFVPFKQFTDGVSISDDAARSYYNTFKEEFTRAPSINVDYIALPFPAAPEQKITEAPSDDETTPGVSEEEKEKVRTLANTISDDLIDTPDLATVAAKHSLTVQESGLFSTEKPNLALGWSYDVFIKLFQLKKDEISDPFETSTGIYIARIKEKKEAVIPSFEEAAKEVREVLTLQAAQQTARTKAKEYRDQIAELLEKTKPKEFTKTAQSLNLEVNQTPLFSRGQYLPQIGISRDFQEAAFSLTNEQPLSSVVETTNGCAILYRDSYEAPDMSAFEKQKDEIAKNLIEEKRNEAFSSYFTRLRIEAKLESKLVKQQNAAAESEQAADEE